MQWIAFATIYLYFTNPTIAETGSKDFIDTLSTTPAVTACETTVFSNFINLTITGSHKQRSFDAEFEARLVKDTRLEPLQIKLNPSLKALGIEFRKDQAEIVVPFAKGEFAAPMRDLNKMLQNQGDADALAADIISLFAAHLPDYRPLFGNDLLRRLAEESRKIGVEPIDGIVIHPAIYSKWMTEKTFPISDIHDLTSHLPMLFHPRIRAQVLKHFRVLSEYLKNPTFANSEKYQRIRSCFYEQFLYFDEVSGLVLGLGGFVQSLKALLALRYESTQDPTDRFFLDKLLHYHNFGEQRKGMVESLLTMLDQLYPRINREFPDFVNVPAIYKGAILQILMSNLVAETPALRSYFSLDNQLRIWDSALREFE